ncbi:MAG: site-specific DNA-methyltransferase [Candidatus Blackburnbacteria bacterium]|nr:site-specific DNA-methyltransferase [Candidatus Blackburnbacteria bacterium]
MPKAYFENNNFKLYLGDCIKLLPHFTGEQFDLIFVDPPYRLSNNGFSVYSGHKTIVNKGGWDKSQGLEKDFEFHRTWLKECQRVLKPNGTIWVSGTYHSIHTCGFALQKLGFHILNEIVWYKPNAPYNLSQRFFTASHETLIWAKKNKNAKHRFNYKYVKDANWNEDFLKSPGEQMRSVWAINSVRPEEQKFGKHPTQKPTALLRRIILASTLQGDLVLDPFTGSSTTGLEAYLYGRKFVGIDVNQKYLDLSIKRLNQLKINLQKKN